MEYKSVMGKMGTGRPENNSPGGDRSASLDRLIDRYYAPVLRLLTRLTGSVSAAEDIAQGVFLSLLKSWRPLGTDDEDRSYVMQAAYNAWRRWGRKKKAEPIRLDLDASLSTTETNPLDDLCTREEVAMATAALGELPHNQRAAVILIVLEGLSYNETARIMGVPRDTVAQWRTRAMSRMFRSLVGRQDRYKEVG